MRKFKYTLTAEIEVEADGIMIAEAFINKKGTIAVKVRTFEPVRTPSNPFPKFPCWIQKLRQR